MGPCQGPETGSTPVIRSVLLSIFSKITQRGAFTKKNLSPDSELYLYILFPIAVSFLIAFVGSRIISHIDPSFFIPILKDVRIHHFSYGIILVVASTYLALVNNGPRSKYLIALLYGFGLGLVFDEFGIWLKLTTSDQARWSYDGLVVLVALFILIISAESGARAWRHHFLRKEVE